MKKGEQKVIKEFPTNEEMLKWLENKTTNVVALTKIYPAIKYSGKLNKVTRQIIITKK